MYHDDHNPPLIHVEYQGHEALMGIGDGGSVSRQVTP
ncbi:MAG: DUF4160 domain-containing protein [Methyloprofundus sp.]|nr:DUF4160 domain-containing protein [Methyloprofundus sp.]